ncbi:MAG TPA: hypothetical protein PKA13_26350 [Geminicoccaceae bacterium]|nr:hypothetical protein [Geminicoccus sp.]HMU53320.1 hypothetical protein [Geminicoccaceae bacterium]
MPELREKLRLLVQYGYFESFEAIAAALGRKPKTLRWWAHGDAARMPGRVPADRYAQVIQLLMDCLIPDVPEQRAQEIAVGPARRMEEQLRAGDAQSIADFIEREGLTRTGRLFLDRQGEIGLVETDRERPAASFKVPLDAWFRIVVEKDLRRKHILALQLASSACGIVSHAVDAGTGHVLLPGLKEDGGLAWMRERRDNGLSRFAVIVTAEAMPADIPSDGAGLSETLLDRLGDVYGRQPRAGREIHLLRVDIVKPG